MAFNSSTHDGPGPGPFIFDPTKRPPPPPGLDLSESRQPLVLGIVISVWLLAMLSIALRVVSRRIKGASLWVDDWIILVSVPFSTAQAFSIAGYGISKGLGKHLWATPPDSLYAWAIIMLISQLSYAVVVVCFKWSILALYWRLFHFQRKSIKIFIWALAAIVFLWGIAVILIPIIQCQPVYAMWARFDPDNPLPAGSYNCRIGQKKFLLFNAVPTLITDILLLVLPIPYTWGLQLPRVKKIGIIATFCLGSFILVVSIIRLSFLVRGNFPNPDITWNFTQIMLWFVAEANVGILCACLPLLLPIAMKMKRSSLSTEGRKTHVEEGTIHTLEQLASHGQNAGETSVYVKAMSSTNTTPRNDLYSHYRNDDDSERSLRRGTEEEVELESLDGREGSTRNGILVTTEISIEK